jgi:hypothetical protein
MAFAQTEILTFDDLPTPVSGNNPGSPIPNGYEGLQWQNFIYLNGVNSFFNPSGYQNGVVSPNNVAFNAYANPAMFSDGLFNLNSAYLTGAWNDGLQVEVQGFVGAALIYDNTYTVNATGPTLINFNYLGVGAVNFISSGGVNHGFVNSQGLHITGTQFVMDNLSITIVPEPSTVTLAGPAFMLLILRLLTNRCSQQPPHLQL